MKPGRGLTARVVKARGRRFNTVHAGTGGPLVIFESGLAASSPLWAEVQRQVAQHTATMSYDRAGHGGSSLSKDGRLFADLNADLEAVLDAIGQEGPLILVGHSWGGPTMRAMAHHTRRPVAGVVVVDGTNAASLKPDGAKMLQDLFAFLSLLGRVQLHRRLHGKLLKGVADGLPAEDKKRALRSLASARTVRAGAAETKGMFVEQANLAELQAKGFPAGAVVTILGAGVADPGGEEIRADFLAMHEQEAKTFGARYVLVENSRHDIHMHEPTLVANEVLRVLEEARASA